MSINIVIVGQSSAHNTNMLGATCHFYVSAFRLQLALMSGWLGAFVPEVYSELRCFCLRRWMRQTQSRLHAH